MFHARLARSRAARFAVLRAILAVALAFAASAASDALLRDAGVMP